MQRRAIRSFWPLGVVLALPVVFGAGCNGGSATAPPFFTGTANPAPTQTPTAAPTQTPTAAPTGSPAAVLLTAAKLAFAATGASGAQTVTASESNYGGQFTISTAAAGQTSSCSGVATASPSSGTAFAVVPTGVGHCTFAIADGSGQTATLTIDVTSTTVGGA
jgi:hypothetical protein